MALSLADQTTLDACLAAVDIPAALAILQCYPDLRHTDLPKVEKKVLAAIAAQPGAIRQLVLGFASLSPSIRRFCKKYYPKLGAAAAADLLYLFVESLDPLRPVIQDSQGLLGSFGGYASPLGQVIQEAKLSLEIRRPEIEVYSDAARLTREVLEPLPAALAATDAETWLLAFEYYYGLGVFYSMTPKDYQSPLAQHSPSLFYHVSYHIADGFKEVVRSRAKKADSQLLAAMQMWIERRLLLDEERWQTTPISPVCDRLRQYHHTYLTPMNLYWFTADHFLWFPQAERVDLYRQIQSSLQSLGGRDAGTVQAAFLRHYQDRYPDEAQAANRSDPEPPFPTPDSPADVPTLSSTLPSARSLQTNANFAADREDIYYHLLSLATWLDLHGIAQQLHREDLKNPWDETFPPVSTDPAVQQDEQLVVRLRQLAKDRVALVDVTADPYQGTRATKAYRSVLGPVLAGIAADVDDYGDQLFKLLQRAIDQIVVQLEIWDGAAAAEPEAARDREMQIERGYYHLIRLMEVALLFLPDRQFPDWLHLWRDRADPLHPFHHYAYNPYDSLPQLMEARFPTEAAFLLLDLQQDVRWPHADSSWQWYLVQAYASGTERGRDVVKTSLQRGDLSVNPHYARCHWHPAYQWMVFQWWDKQDVELLAIACDRCAIPMYWKGEKAYCPVVKTYRDDRGYAARTYESADGAIAVSDICQRVYHHDPERLAAIVEHNLQLAGQERSACTLLLGFATVATDLTPFQAHLTAWLDLLESPETFAIATALQLFTTHPSLATDILPDLLLACDRALAASSTSVAKHALNCLGQLAIALTDAQDHVVTSLENSLYSETPSILEETLKVWKKLLGTVKTMEFPTTAIDRLHELSIRDPKRYAKAVQHLLK